MKFIDLTGQKFGRWTVIKPVGKDKWGHVLWSCSCSCRKEKVVDGNSLKRGLTKSCGCLSRDNHLKHGHSTRSKVSNTHRVWSHMKERCTNPNNKQYKDYGGRGIAICDRWLPENNGFVNFLRDMGEIPKGKFLDRIDNNLLNGGYSPKNCKLSTRKERMRNTQRNINITFKEKTQCLQMWAEELKIDYMILWHRLYRLNWSIEKTFTTPLKEKKSLSFNNYKYQLRYSLRNLISKNKNKIGFSKYFPYNSKQLCDHLESIRKAQNNCCSMCNISYDINPFDVDHILPVSSAKTTNELFQLFLLDNLSLLCFKCNRWIKRNKVTINAR